MTLPATFISNVLLNALRLHGPRGYCQFSFPFLLGASIKRHLLYGPRNLCVCDKTRHMLTENALKQSSQTQSSMNCCRGHERNRSQPDDIHKIAYKAIWIGSKKGLNVRPRCDCQKRFRKMTNVKNNEILRFRILSVSLTTTQSQHQSKCSMCSIFLYFLLEKYNLKISKRKINELQEDARIYESLRRSSYCAQNVATEAKTTQQSRTCQQKLLYYFEMTFDFSCFQIFKTCALSMFKKNRRSK